MVGESLFIVKSGTVRIIQRTADGERELGTLGPGEHLGELGVLAKSVRLVSAVAATPCEVHRDHPPRVLQEGDREAGRLPEARARDRRRSRRARRREPRDASRAGRAPAPRARCGKPERVGDVHPGQERETGRMLERLVTMLGAESLAFGYGFVFVILVLCGFGLPMPEDVVLVTGGVLAWLAVAARARPRRGRCCATGGCSRMVLRGARRDPGGRLGHLLRRSAVRRARRGLPAAPPDHHPREARAGRAEDPAPRQRRGGVRAVPARPARADVLHGRVTRGCRTGSSCCSTAPPPSSPRRSGSASASGSGRTSRRRRASPARFGHYILLARRGGARSRLSCAGQDRAARGRGAAAAPERASRALPRLGPRRRAGAGTPRAPAARAPAAGAPRPAPPEPRRRRRRALAASAPPPCSSLRRAAARPLLAWTSPTAPCGPC